MSSRSTHAHSFRVSQIARHSSCSTTFAAGVQNEGTDGRTDGRGSLPQSRSVVRLARIIDTSLKTRFTRHCASRLHKSIYTILCTYRGMSSETSLKTNKKRFTRPCASRLNKYIYTMDSYVSKHIMVHKALRHRLLYEQAWESRCEG